MSTRYDIIIVGGSMAGLACAYALRAAGTRVCVLEGETPGHAKSSSFGTSRMFREMYSDPHLCGMSRRANAMWRAMEDEHDVVLRDVHGLLFYGESWDEETIEGSIPGARAVMTEQGIPFESLDAAAIAERFPMAPRGDFVGLFEPTAGAIRADRALATFRSGAERGGIEIRTGARVTAIELDAGHARVRTREHVFDAEQVVVAAGGATNELLAPLGLDLPLTLWAMLWGYYAVEPSLARAYPQWFCFQRERPQALDGGLYYGFPVESLDDPMIKVGIDWAPTSMRTQRLAALPREPVQHLAELLDAFVATGLRGVGPVRERQCSPYTMTADANFIVDRLHPRLCTFTGGSGQAFKFAPLLGSLLADLALDRRIDLDLAPWSASRPALRAAAA
ncbi:MAG: FAD-dependent oxidoreductase [Myxococcota bacterium]